MVFDTIGVFEFEDSTPRQLDAGERQLVSQKSVEFGVRFHGILCSGPLVASFVYRSCLLIIFPRAQAGSEIILD